MHFKCAQNAGNFFQSPKFCCIHLILITKLKLLEASKLRFADTLNVPSMQNIDLQNSKCLYCGVE